MDVLVGGGAGGAGGGMPLRCLAMKTRRNETQEKEEWGVENRKMTGGRIQTEEKKIQETAGRQEKRIHGRNAITCSIA